MAATVERFGRIDGLVNNAARITRCVLETATPELFDITMAVNVRAPLLLIQAALPYFLVQVGAASNIGVNQCSLRRVEPAALLHLQGRPDDAGRVPDAYAPEHVQINQLNVLDPDAQRIPVGTERWIAARLAVASAFRRRALRLHPCPGRGGHGGHLFPLRRGRAHQRLGHVEKFLVIGRNPVKEAK